MEKEKVEERRNILKLLGKGYKSICRGIKNVNSEGYKYRYVLNLESVNEDNNGKKVMFILKNPSMATHEKEDKTLIRLAGWTYNKDIHNFTVCNIYAYVETHENKLKGLEQSERIGESNNDEIRKCLIDHKEIILGLGAPNKWSKKARKDYDSRIKEILEFEEIKNKDKELFKIGKYDDDYPEEYPKHPRWWSYKMEKSRFNIQKAVENLNNKFT